MPTIEKKIYLTFDDGPHPLITPIVLDMLAQYYAKATFFCIGKNVVNHPETYQAVLDAGHAVGNHSHNHWNGFKTDDAVYLDDIAEAGKYISTNLYRPPYGRMTSFQASQMALPRFNYKIIMWSVLSGDFDPETNKEKCLANVLLKSGKGDIVVFHDSQKASEKMLFTLPKVLKNFSEKGFEFCSLKDVIV